MSANSSPAGSPLVRTKTLAKLKTQKSASQLLLEQVFFLISPFLSRACCFVCWAYCLCVRVSLFCTAACCAHSLCCCTAKCATVLSARRASEVFDMQKRRQRR